MRQNLLRCAQHFLWVSAVIFGVSGLSVRAEEPPAAAPVETPAAAPVAAPVVVSEQAPVAEFVGSEACAACHGDVVESFKGARHGKMLPKHKGIEFEKACETCHGPGSLHAGAGGDKTDPGFNTVKMFKKLDTAAITNACMACHKDADRTHWSGSSHHRANVSCLSCHSLHNAKGHGDLVAKNTSETCYV
ncbi:MAG: hypothetical protein KBG07_06325, partial [Elusimicrobia bacterium]|nr:hypothetical protein [Elusimicrobiota bacterium]